MTDWHVDPKFVRDGKGLRSRIEHDRRLLLTNRRADKQAGKGIHTTKYEICIIELYRYKITRVFMRVNFVGCHYQCLCVKDISKVIFYSLIYFFSLLGECVVKKQGRVMGKRKKNDFFVEYLVEIQCGRKVSFILITYFVANQSLYFVFVTRYSFHPYLLV